MSAIYGLPFKKNFLETFLCTKTCNLNHFAMREKASYCKENIGNKSFNRLYSLPSNGSDDNTLLK